MKILRTIATSLLVLVVVAVAGVFVLGQFDRLPFQTRTVDRSQPVLLQSVQEISQFHAAVGTFEVILDQEEDVRWVPGFIAGERSLFVAAGTVNAYVDLSGLADGDLTLSEDGTTARIRLPEAQLDPPNLDHDRTYLYSQDRGVINRLGDAISTQDQQELYQLAEEKMTAAAQESGLTQQAEENTRTMLTGMFSALDIQLTVVGD
ncbi:hypothetical protein BJF81_14745 [Ornithinimicrobium sp. CNJ-824]|uniref:DUF4230 domain-containing protein n=1 Tax=Ornithinimicrobium sp. CNJ-824 TaxID=1904966 RepID=UPI000967467E|nr:DUF4230 domain-containing protein [Ornithinimicrobium sp. CNJ-824]OLT21803.1 hypothetical protein BJF81_14745 [Ornithinimicrobium sp. CNJ-824]